MSPLTLYVELPSVLSGLRGGWHRNQRRGGVRPGLLRPLGGPLLRQDLPDFWFHLGVAFGVLPCGPAFHLL